MENKKQLEPEELSSFLKEHPSWVVDGVELKREFRFESYQKITSFLNHLVQTITELNHHPDFSLNNAERSVPVSISTHSAGALTQADLDFVQALDQFDS